MFYLHMNDEDGELQLIDTFDSADAAVKSALETWWELHDIIKPYRICAVILNDYGVPEVVMTTKTLTGAYKGTVRVLNVNTLAVELKEVEYLLYEDGTYLSNKVS
jgi:hypothetical protein